MTEKKKRSVRCRSRFRILSRDLIALGPGKVDLLESIGREGSISQAARESHLSYRRAWNMVDIMNQCFKKPLVISVTGGKGGGGAKLTPTGEKVIQLYRKMEKKPTPQPKPNGKPCKSYCTRRTSGGNWQPLGVGPVCNNSLFPSLHREGPGEGWANIPSGNPHPS